MEGELDCDADISRLLLVFLMYRGSAACLGLRGDGGQQGRCQDFLDSDPRQDPDVNTYPKNLVSPRVLSTLFWEY